MVKTAFSTIAVTGGMATTPPLCQWDDMDRKRYPVGGGFAVMLCTVVGSIWGLRIGQGSAGLVIGLAVGLAFAALVWVIDSRR